MAFLVTSSWKCHHSEGELEEEENPVPNAPENTVTLGQIMTDGRFKISSFLAAATSAHNRGNNPVAVGFRRFSGGQQLPGAGVQIGR